MPCSRGRWRRCEAGSEGANGERIRTKGRQGSLTRCPHVRAHHAERNGRSSQDPSGLQLLRGRRPRRGAGLRSVQPPFRGPPSFTRTWCVAVGGSAERGRASESSGIRGWHHRLDRRSAFIGHDRGGHEGDLQYSWLPYTDQVEGQELYLKTQKHVVAHGHVSGIEWSLAAYETRAAAGYLGGSCGDLFVGDMGEYGGIGFCLHTGETTLTLNSLWWGSGITPTPPQVPPWLRGSCRTAGRNRRAPAGRWHDLRAQALRRPLRHRGSILRDLRRRRNGRKDRCGGIGWHRGGP